MKVLSRRTIAAIACMLLAGGASALEISLGVKGAVNFAKPIGADERMKRSLKMMPGMVAGFSAELKVAEVVSIQPEALFVQKGTKEEVDELIMGESFNVASVTIRNYIEIPVLFKVHLPVVAIRPNFYAGPAVAFRIGVNGYTESGGEKASYTTKMRDAIEEETNAVDFGLAFGGGLAIPAGSGSVIIDARYTLGLMDVDKEKTEFSSGKNGGIALMAGYSFPFGG